MSVVCFFCFCYSLNAHYMQAAPSLNLVLITQNINYLQTENSHWSFTLYSSIFLWLSCVIFPSWHQLHLGSLEILVFLSTLTVAYLIAGRGKFLFLTKTPPVACFQVCLLKGFGIFLEIFFILLHFLLNICHFFGYC